jgi:hypothetical protein
LSAGPFGFRIHPAFYAFACIIALHGMIAVLNLRTTVPAIYGAKLLINVCSASSPRQFDAGGKTVLGLFALIWLFTLGGVILDKFIYTFPWMGLGFRYRGIQVMFHWWDIDSGFESVPRDFPQFRFRPPCCCRRWRW